MAFQPGTTNRTAIRFVREQSFKTIPIGQNLESLRYTGESVAYNRRNITSNEIRDDRMTADLIVVGADVSGDLNYELSYNSFDTLIAAALCSEWSAPSSGVSTIKNGVVLQSFTIQKHFQDLAVPIFQNFVGCRIGGMNLDFQTGQILTGTFSVMGCFATSSPNQIGVGQLASVTVTDGGTGYTSATVTATGGGGSGAVLEAVLAAGVITAINVINPGSGYTSAPTISITGPGTDGAATAVLGTASTIVYPGQGNEPMNAVSNLSGIEKNDVAMAAQIRSMSMELTNNLRGQEAIGTLGYIGIALGRLEITGNIELYFEDSSEYQTFLDNDDFKFEFVVQDSDGNSYAFTFPRVKYEEGTILSGGLDQDLMVNGRWRAIYHAGTNCMIEITRTDGP